MKNASVGSKKLQILIIILLSLNLAATILIILAVSILMVNSTPNSRTSLRYEPLPPGLTTGEERSALFKEFKQNYNKGDNEKLWSMYGEAYQLQLPLETLNKLLEPVRRITSRINKGAYSYYESEELAGGRMVFKLFYSIQTPEGSQTL